MGQTIIEIAIEPGADTLLKPLGRRLGTKTRSKAINGIVDHLRENIAISDLMDWCRVPKLIPNRRSTLRISSENAQWLSDLAETIGRSRPLIVSDLIYFAAANLGQEDLIGLS